MPHEDFARVLEGLRDDADGIVKSVGFLEAVLDNPDVPDRLGQSVSGTAGVVAIESVIHSVLLYCARAWGNRRDEESIPNAVRLLPSLRDLVERRRPHPVAAIQGLQPHLLPTHYIRARRAYRRMQGAEVFGGIRVYRTEVLAHRVTNSNDRIRLEREGRNVDPPSYGDLADEARKAVVLVGDLGYLWDQLVNPYPDRIERACRQAREFWRCMPRLRDVENQV